MKDLHCRDNLKTEEIQKYPLKINGKTNSYNLSLIGSTQILFILKVTPFTLELIIFSAWIKAKEILKYLLK